MKSFTSLLQVLLIPALLDVASGQTNPAGTMNNDERMSGSVDMWNRLGLSPNNGKTIFTPSNVAWQNLQANEPWVFEKYTTQAEFYVHLREVMQWSVATEEAVTSDELFDGRRGLLENAWGNMTIDQRNKKVDNVPFIKFQESNITTSQGYIHLIDEVIIPPYMAVNLIEHLLNWDTSETFAYTTMANLALAVELDETIDGLYENGFTFMVPPNRRFNRAQLNVPELLKPESRDYTRDFVLGHMLNETYHEAAIFAFNEQAGEPQRLVQSMLGTSFWITTTFGRIRFQSVEVLLTDRPARNGIFHVLDYTIFPPFISDFTELTAISTEWDTSGCYRFFVQALLTSEQISNMFNTTLTMFCPTATAFEGFNREDYNRLLEPKWERHATEFLLNHISAGARSREELVAEAPGYIDMLNGARYELRRSGDRVRIKNTKIEQARSQFVDIMALDGILHIVDSALTPTAVSQSIYDQSNNNPDFSLLIENIDFVDLQDMVDRDLPLTLFAPDNTAWRRVTFGTLEGGDIIKRHLVEGLNFCDVVANETQLVALTEETLDVELRGEPGSGLWGLEKQNLFVGGAYVYTCDLFARNGILHHVDRVIGLDYDTVAPTISPAPTITASPTMFIPPSPAPVVPASTFKPIALPPGIPGVRPSVATDDAPEVPQSGASTTMSTTALLLGTLLFAGALI